MPTGILLLDVVVNLIPVLLLVKSDKSTDEGSCNLSEHSSVIDSSGDVSVSVFVSTVVVGCFFGW